MLWFSKAAQVFAIYLAEIVTYLTILTSKNFLSGLYWQEWPELFEGVWMGRWEMPAKLADHGMLSLTAYAIFRSGSWNLKHKTWQKEGGGGGGKKEKPKTLPICNFLRLSRNFWAAGTNMNSLKAPLAPLHPKDGTQQTVVWVRDNKNVWPLRYYT